MSTATAIQKPIREVEGDQCVAIRDIGWKAYCTLLRLRGERSMPRMVKLRVQRPNQVGNRERNPTI
jgi:hypothetical protein